MVECIGGPLDGQRHDYATGDPMAPGGMYVLDRRYSENRGQKREYVYLWRREETI